MTRAPGTVITATLLPTVVLLLASCGGSTASDERQSAASGDDTSLREVVLEVPTIWCGSCKPRVEASARNVPGVQDVKFDERIIQRVVVTYDSSQTTPRAIVEAIEKRGDRVTVVSEP